eukprot:Lankesteria_metandrocarpae@DN2386_c0_g1_i1.p1
MVKMFTLEHCQIIFAAAAAVLLSYSSVTLTVAAIEKPCPCRGVNIGKSSGSYATFFCSDCDDFAFPKNVGVVYLVRFREGTTVRQDVVVRTKQGTLDEVASVKKRNTLFGSSTRNNCKPPDVEWNLHEFSDVGRCEKLEHLAVVYEFIHNLDTDKTIKDRQIEIEHGVMIKAKKEELNGKVGMVVHIHDGKRPIQELMKDLQNSNGLGYRKLNAKTEFGPPPHLWITNMECNDISYRISIRCLAKSNSLWKSGLKDFQNAPLEKQGDILLDTFQMFSKQPIGQKCMKSVQALTHATIKELNRREKAMEL